MKYLTIAEWWGRRGNLYHQIAGTIGLARKYGYQPAIPANFVHRNEVSLPEEYYLDVKPTRIINEKSYAYDPNFLDGVTDDVVGIRAGLQSYKYWEDIKEEIYSYLRPKEASDFGKWSVGVAIRRGDYVNNSAYKQYDIDYYKSAMKKYFSDPRYVFYIISDDYKYIESHFEHSERYIMAYRTPYEDFCNLASCQNFILSGSSFSFWGAFLSPGGGRTYRVPRTHAGHLADLDESSSYMPNWIIHHDKNNVVLCCYADNKYKEKQDRLVSLNTENRQFDEVFAYTRDWLLKTDFYNSHKDILDDPAGSGLWLWKPYIILESLNRLQENDMLVYMDCGDLYFGEFRKYLIRELNNHGIILTDSFNVNKDYTKRDCFIGSDCDSDEFHNCYQVEAGVIAVKNTPKTKKIITEWLNLCCNKSLIDNSPSIKDKDFPSFIAHRNDQSLLTLTKVNFNLYATNEIRNYVACNMETEPSDVDLMDVTFVCVLRYDSKDRQENVDLMIAYLNKHYKTNILFGEIGTKHFDYVSSFPNVKYVHFDDEEFHRTKYLNELIASSDTPYICNHDCDVVVPVVQMVEAVNRLRNGDDFCYPFDGGFCHVPRDLYPLIKTALETGVFSGRDFKGRGDQSVGGVVLANKDSHFKVGGELEQLVGWGFEDVSRARRYFNYGKCTRVNGVLYHMDHFVGKDSRPGDGYAIANSERRKMKAMSKEELWDYIQTWPWRAAYFNALKA